MLANGFVSHGYFCLWSGPQTDAVRHRPTLRQVDGPLTTSSYLFAIGVITWSIVHDRTAGLLASDTKLIAVENPDFILRGTLRTKESQARLSNEIAVNTLLSRIRAHKEEEKHRPQDICLNHFFPP
jgi:hypothetical protein